MKTKLFERLVTKFSIKVNDLAKYLEISKATIYNYRNLDNFSDIPSDKQLKIFYLFGKENAEDLELVLDESDTDILNKYLERISSILRESVQDNKDSLVSLEALTNKVKTLEDENFLMKRQLKSLEMYKDLDEFTVAIILEKVGSIVNESSKVEIKQFLDYLEIYDIYKKNSK